MKTKLKLLALSASLLACGLGLSGNAQANAYAFAYNQIRQGHVTVLNGDGSPGVSTSSTGTAGTPLPKTRLSDVVGGPNPDPLPATQGIPVRTNENIGGGGVVDATGYTPFGKIGTAYSWADAATLTEQNTPTSFIRTRNAAEGNIVGNGIASSQASNSSTNILQIFSGGGTIQFDFEANPYEEIALDANSKIFASKAEASLKVDITIRDTSNNSIIFNWSPDGIINTIGGSIGGTELADPENLNGSLGTILPGTSATFSPLNTFSTFSAKSKLIPMGLYEISLTMVELQNVRNTVPEPGMLALVGLTLGAMGLTLRRKRV